MARTRMGRRSRRIGRRGLLVHESNLQRGVGQSGIYSIPYFVGDLDVTGAVSENNSIGLKSGSSGPENYVFGNKIERPVRFSSMTVASDSPFAVMVRTINDGWVRYQVSGEKPTKIYFSRENSIAGNSVALKQFSKSFNGNFASIVKFVGASDKVDVTTYVSFDSSIS